MRKSLFLLLSLTLGGCSTSTGRTPTVDAVTDFQTRDGATVSIPGLRSRLTVPECNALDAKVASNHGECAASDEAELFNKITHLSFNFQTAQNPS